MDRVEGMEIRDGEGRREREKMDRGQSGGKKRRWIGTRRRIGKAMQIWIKSISAPNQLLSWGSRDQRGSQSAPRIIGREEPMIDRQINPRPRWQQLIG